MKPSVSRALRVENINNYKIVRLLDKNKFIQNQTHLQNKTFTQITQYERDN